MIMASSTKYVQDYQQQSYHIHNNHIIVEIEEPLELKQIDKKELVDNYILDLLDEIKKDQILTSEMLRSWQSYEILNVLYGKLALVYLSSGLVVNLPIKQTLFINTPLNLLFL